MSVILTLADVIVTQGFNSSAWNVTLTNTGTEGVKNNTLKIKVTDSVIFDELKARVGLSYPNCLNTFMSIPFTFGNIAPNGGSKLVTFTVDVKAGAPIQVHNLTCDYQYEAY